MRMLVKNLTKKSILSGNAELCNTILSKSVGLMFSRKKGRALILEFYNERAISLHMFFVFYPIDVLFLDKNRIVVDKKENFMPFTLYSSKRKAMYAVELPQGAIKRTKTEIGDRVEF